MAPLDLPLFIIQAILARLDKIQEVKEKICDPLENLQVSCREASGFMTVYNKNPRSSYPNLAFAAIGNMATTMMFRYE